MTTPDPMADGGEAPKAPQTKPPSPVTPTGPIQPIAPPSNVPHDQSAERSVEERKAALAAGRAGAKRAG
jgi:hypothetical protein